MVVARIEFVEVWLIGLTFRIPTRERERDAYSLLAHLARLLLLGSLFWTGFGSFSHLIGLAQCFVGFCSFLCHAHSFPQA